MKSMEILTQKISLGNSCDLIDKSKDVFSPVKEAVTNALDAISQRQSIGENFTPAISVAMHFGTEENLLKEKFIALDFIAIEDNGIGFTSENLLRFKELGEKTKGLNNRGTGKIQIFHHFNEISIDSSFVERNEWNKLNASWKLPNGEYDASLIKIGAQADRRTIIKISNLSGGVGEREFYT